jgi:hypothetical protein
MQFIPRHWVSREVRSGQGRFMWPPRRVVLTRVPSSSRPAWRTVMTLQQNVPSRGPRVVAPDELNAEGDRVGLSHKRTFPRHHTLIPPTARNHVPETVYENNGSRQASLGFLTQSVRGSSPRLRPCRYTRSTTISIATPKAAECYGSSTTSIREARQPQRSRQRPRPSTAP